jgi:lipopolysaccharide transport system ATP-binding protein
MTRLVTMTGIAKAFPRGGQAARFGGLWHALRGDEQPGAITVLRDIDLHVDQGESVGLVGENGAGKSTLLKILAGVLQPSAGQVGLQGQLGALLELGAGFHPNYTGRQNIQLSATLAGMSTTEIASAMSDIEAFADIGTAIDEPIRHYSSGMVVRLGFAVMTASRPDLLVTDEVLAVGDESFQRKCLRWIEQYIDAGGTLLLVSHSTDAVRRLCQRAYWLHEGCLKESGQAAEVIDHYLAFLDNREQQRQQGDPDVAAGLYRLTRVLVNDSEEPLVMLEQDQALNIHCCILSPDDRAPVMAVGLKDRHGTPVYGLTSEFDQVSPLRVAPKRYELGIELDLAVLSPGRYSLNAHALDPEGLRLFDTVSREILISGEPEGEGFYRGREAIKLA